MFEHVEEAVRNLKLWANADPGGKAFLPDGKEVTRSDLFWEVNHQTPCGVDALALILSGQSDALGFRPGHPHRSE